MSEKSIRAIRPQTKRLERPTPNINHPVIEISPIRTSPRQSPETLKPNTNGFSLDLVDSKDISDRTIQHGGLRNSDAKRPPLQRSFVLQSVPTNKNGSSSEQVNNRKAPLDTGNDVESQANKKAPNTIPAPCTACDRDVAPERLHSHTPPGWRPPKVSHNNNNNNNNENQNGKVTSRVKKISSIRAGHSARTNKSVASSGSNKWRDSETRSNLSTQSASGAIKSMTSRSQTTQNDSVKRQGNNQQSNTTKDNSSTSDNKTETVKGPPMFLCYICGRGFGSKSLPIHEPKCLEKWKMENDALPREQRRPLPQKPDGLTNMSRNEYNEKSWQIFNSQLLPCSKCGRTFFANRLPIHERACKAQVKSAPSAAQSLNSTTPRDDDVIFLDQSPTPKRPVRAPLSIPCYICGRMFGSMSISVHEPQCLKKWRHENEQLPSHLQRPEPVKPVIELKDDGTIDVDAVAEASWKSHLQQLVPCSRCGRTFFPDRLPVHERSCKVDPASVDSGIKSGSATHMQKKEELKT